MKHPFLSGAVAAVCFFLLWLAWVMKVDVAECVLGGCCALAAAVAATAFGVTARIRFEFRWRMVLEGWRIPFYCVTGSWELLQALGAQLFRRRGADNDLAALRDRACARTPLAAARRALRASYATSTPNFVVLGTLPGRRWLLIHRVHKGKIIRMVRNLGGEPFSTPRRRKEQP